MATLKTLFEQQQAGLTVYSPDCVQSRLWGNLDKKIMESTSLQVGFRAWIYHDVNSINRFYSDGQEDIPLSHDSPQEKIRQIDAVPIEKLQSGHLFVKLLLMGPSLLTIWFGENAIEKLLKLKGKTHPAESETGTIRGGFWCDNLVCNLMHSSDNAAEAIRELKAVGFTDLLDNSPTVTGCPAQPTTIAGNYVSHSSIVIVCDVINRMLLTSGDAPLLTYELTISGDAQATMQLLVPLLTEAANTLSQHPLAQFIHAYLAGNAVTVTNLMQQLPVTQWERFVIQCGVLTRSAWLKENPKF
jgi:nucleoside diphosphate kinase